MKTFVLTAACALALGAALPAHALEVLDNAAAQRIGIVHPNMAALPYPVMPENGELSELPEPEVFAMMLLGLVLLGYRASRDTYEKFK